MTYGYRLFYFEVHEKFAHSAFDLTEPVMGQSIGDVLEGLLSDLAADVTTTRWAVPALKKAADSTDLLPATPSRRGDRAIKWHGWQRPGTLHFTTTVHYGSVQGHPIAIGRPAEIDIDGTAPAHLYRVEILLPKSGSTGLIIAEDVDRLCPGPAVAQWFGKQSQLNAAGGPWLRFRSEPLSDSTRLAELIQNAKKAEIRLTASGKDLGQGRFQSPLKINSSVARAQERDSLIDRVQFWKDAAPTKEEAILTLAELAGTDVTGLDFVDADIYLDDGTNRHRIDPTSLNEVFRYETGDRQLSDDEWAAELLTKLSGLYDMLKFDVQW